MTLVVSPKSTPMVFHRNLLPLLYLAFVTVHFWYLDNQKYSYFSHLSFEDAETNTISFLIHSKSYNTIFMVTLLKSQPLDLEALWQESHGNRQSLCEFSWFYSHPVRPYLWDQERMLDPYQDRLFQHLTFPPWHHSPSATFYSPNDGPYLQQCWATSPLKDHIII